jgi:hypothetical protein
VAREAKVREARVRADKARAIRAGRAKVAVVVPAVAVETQITSFESELKRKPWWFIQEGRGRIKRLGRYAFSPLSRND